MPFPFNADTGTKGVSPPQSSGVSPFSDNWVLIESTFESSLSILFTATTIGTFADLAWLIASSVCGITPSSAATTNIIISVKLAPLDLIAEKAACPGVSIKTKFFLLTLKLYAPIDCVIPPCSLSTTLDFLI